jgi:hypothetical protein
MPCSKPSRCPSRTDILAAHRRHARPVAGWTKTETTVVEANREQPATACVQASPRRSRSLRRHVHGKVLRLRKRSARRTAALRGVNPYRRNPRRDVLCGHHRHAGRGTRGPRVIARESSHREHPARPARDCSRDTRGRTPHFAVLTSEGERMRRCLLDPSNTVGVPLAECDREQTSFGVTAKPRDQSQFRHGPARMALPLSKQRQPREHRQRRIRARARRQVPAESTSAMCFSPAVGRWVTPAARRCRLPSHPRLGGLRPKRLEEARELQRRSRPAASSLLERLLFRIVATNRKLRSMRLRRRN